MTDGQKVTSPAVMAATRKSNAKLTIADALIILDAAVATQGPDFIYNPPGHGGCGYLPNPVASLESKRITGCLVGTWLELRGEPATSADEGAAAYAMLRGRGYQPIVCNLLDTAQNWQDGGGTWGESRSEGIDHIKHWLYDNWPDEEEVNDSDAFST